MSSSGIAFCDTCRIEFKSRAILRFHSKKVHGQDLTEGNNLVHDPDKVRVAFCTTCQREFKSQAILKFHLRKEHGLTLTEENNLVSHLKDNELGLHTKEKQLLLKFGKLPGIPDFVNSPFRLLRPILTQLSEESQTQSAGNAAVEETSCNWDEVSVGSDRSNPPSPVSILSPPMEKVEERSSVTENSDDEHDDSVVVIAESIPHPQSNLKGNSQNCLNEETSASENFEMPRQHKRSAASSFISETSSYKDWKRIKLNSDSMSAPPNLSLGRTTDEVSAVATSMVNNSFLLSPDQSPPPKLDQRSVSSSPVASETASSVGRKKISLRSNDEVSRSLSLSPSSNIDSASASLMLKTANQESQEKRRSGSMTSLVGTESTVSSLSSFSSMSGGKRSSSGKFNQTCSICGKTGFKNSSRFLNHLEIHEGKRPFVCPICGSGYETDIKLLQHNSLRHSQEAPFKCEKCGKEYKLERAFQNHELSCSSSD